MSTTPISTTMQAIEQSELYWLAGLLEGEGSFLRGSPSGPNKTRIQCCMCDEDVIARVARCLGVSYWEAKRKTTQRNAHHKRSWATAISGSRARSFMEMLHPLMGERRKKQIEQALSSYAPELSRVKLSQSDVVQIRDLLQAGVHTQAAIAKLFGVERSGISRIKSGKIWKASEES